MPSTPDEPGGSSRSCTDALDACESSNGEGVARPRDIDTHDEDGFHAGHAGTLCSGPGATPCQNRVEEGRASDLGKVLTGAGVRVVSVVTRRPYALEQGVAG